MFNLPHLKRFDHGCGDRHGRRVRAGSVAGCGPGVAEPPSPGLSWLLLLLSLLLLLLPRRPRPHGPHRASCANAQPRRQALQHSHPACKDNTRLLSNAYACTLMQFQTIYKLYVIIWM